MTHQFDYEFVIIAIENCQSTQTKNHYVIISCYQTDAIISYLATVPQCQWLGLNFLSQYQCQPVHFQVEFLHSLTWFYTENYVINVVTAIGQSFNNYAVDSGIL